MTPDPMELLEGIKTNELEEFTPEAAIKFYRRTSYSSLELFHICPRKWQLSRFVPRDKGDMHTAFGHAVGEGIARVAIGDSLSDIVFDTFLKFEAGITDKLKHKSFATALEAIRTFEILWREQLSLEWEVFYVNGKPAAELGLLIHIGPYQYRGFVDLVLRNKHTGELAILENKTTGAKTAIEAMYGNSNQSLGYAIVLDKIAPDTSSYYVLHTVYQAGENKWNVFPVVKDAVKRANWLRDMVYTVRTLEMYQEDENFPLNGAGCVAYGKQCYWYGTCDNPTSVLIPQLPVFEEEPADKYAYVFTIEELLNQQVENFGG